MHFCDVCDNMMLHRDGKTMVCRCCQAESQIQTKTFVFKRQLKMTTTCAVNKNLKYDPTLPLVNIACVNCPNTKIKAMRYGNSKIVKICPKCDTVWE